MGGQGMRYPKRGQIWLILSVAGWIFLVLIGVGLVLAGPAASALWSGIRLQASGVEVTGQITSRAQGTRSCGRNNLDSCAEFDVGFGFDAAGVRQVGTASVTAAVYGGLREGGTIGVRYVSGDPATYEVDFGTTLIGAVGLWVVALLFLVPGAMGLAARMRMAARLTRLRDTGALRGAVVTAVERSNTRVNGIQLWVMRWRDEAGAAGQCRMQRQVYLPEVGAAITVYADPEGRLPAVWEGDSGTRSAAGTRL